MSKFAVEAFSDGLFYEVRQFGITVHTIEPTVFRTGINKVQLDKNIYWERYDKLSDEIKAAYEAEETINYRVNTMRQCVEHIASDDINQVIDIYLHAILSRYPYNRYVVGNFSGITKFISLLPFTLQRLCMKQSGRAS